MNVVWHPAVSIGGNIHISGTAIAGFDWQLHEGYQDGTVIAEGSGPSGSFDINLGTLDNGHYTITTTGEKYLEFDVPPGGVAPGPPGGGPTK